MPARKTANLRPTGNRQRLPIDKFAKMLFRKDHIKKLTAGLGMSKAELLAKIQETHPQKNFNEVFVVADEEARYVAIATYKVEYKYRGHPPSLAFAVCKDDSRVEEIDHVGYGLGIK